jgi:hypothetical protein
VLAGSEAACYRLAVRQKLEQPIFKLFMNYHHGLQEMTQYTTILRRTASDFFTPSANNALVFNPLELLPRRNRTDRVGP